MFLRNMLMSQSSAVVTPVTPPTTVSTFGFDGSGDDVDIGSSTSLTDLTGDQTWCCWMQSSSFTSPSALMYKSPADFRGPRLGISGSGKVDCTVRQTVGNSANFGYIEHAAVLSTSTWYFVVMRVDTTANLLSLFVNGVKQTTAYTFAVGTSSDALVIGSDDFGARRFSGSITKPFIYNRAISDGEEATLRNSGNTPVFSALPSALQPSDSSCVFALNLDSDDDGALDLSGNSNDGTKNGGVSADGANITVYS